MFSRIIQGLGFDLASSSTNAAATQLLEPRDPRLVTTKVIRKRADDVRDSARLRTAIALDLDASPVFAFQD